ncbi:MAG: hypothetical protein ACPGJV_00355 [Bacteriovoracaceae bacterium]
MSKILVIIEDETILKLVSTTLKTELSQNVQVANEARSAIAQIKNNSYDLVICQDVVKKQKCARSLQNYKETENESYKLLSLGKEGIITGQTHFLELPFQHEDFLSKVYNLLNPASPLPENPNLPPYMPYELFYFSNMALVPCDIYLKVTKSDGDHYVKRLLKDDELDPEIIEKYEQKNIPHFYIKSSDRHLLFNYVSQMTFQAVLSTNPDEIHLDLEANSSHFQIVQDIINQVGMSQETIQLCDKMVGQLKDNVKIYSELLTYLREALSQPTSYLYKHNYLNLLFTAHVSPYLNWADSKYNNVLIQKMSYVCFFHDITLNDEKLVRVSNKIDFYRADLTEEEKNQVLSHAHDAADLLSRYKGMPGGVDSIIKQHHGTTNGIGFTDYYKSSISRMAILFIVIEEFVDQILNYQDHRMGLIEILDAMDRKFELPSYHKIVEALKESFNKKKKKKVA